LTLIAKLRQLACESAPLDPFTAEICPPTGSGTLYKGFWTGTLVAVRTLEHADMAPTAMVSPYLLRPVYILNTCFPNQRRSSMQFKCALHLFRPIDEAMTEIQKWLTLAHPHVLRPYAPFISPYDLFTSGCYLVEFLGANHMDNDPFLVTPYIQKGNVSQYIQMYPNCNKIKIVSCPPHSTINIWPNHRSHTRSYWG
jgi:hypothetical protein